MQMALLNFMKSAGDEMINSIFREVNTGSYTECQVAFYDATGRRCATTLF